MIVHNVKQNSTEWHMLRIGIPTASCFDRIITPKTGKLSSQASGYMHWLLAEWIVGAPLETAETAWMQRGTEMEPEAVKSYEFETGNTAMECGFITTDDGMVGGSPDRLIGSDGILEIKCPAPQTHVGYMVAGVVDQDYRVQLQGQLWVCERKWTHIQSYCPGLPSVIIEVKRDEEYIEKLSEAVKSFVEVMLKVREELTQKYGPFTRRAERMKADDPLGITEEDLEAILADRNR
jgi:YqaJ-like recombinase protein